MSCRATPHWQFWIDVGGTFTDCVGLSPRGETRTAKVLSSAALKGALGEGSCAAEVVDPRHGGVKDDLYRGYTLALLDGAGRRLGARIVRTSSGARGALVPESPFDTLDRVAGYELRSPEEAPLLAIRLVLGRRLDEPIGTVELRLGTTRGTNALLERSGPRTAFVTTLGFADILRIGTQARPRLFALDIVKPPPLFDAVDEVDERLAADGTVLRRLDREDARTRLLRLREGGIESLAIALLHSGRNAVHEEELEAIARDVGFEHVARSSRSSAAPKLVPRGDTTLVDAYLTPVLGRYVGHLERSAPDARLRLLTSAGGLASGRSFTGKDSVLSGPAGGVVGVAGVGTAAGFDRLIGFDMGGTSTDVSRFDGRFEMQYEAEKAGVRIATPLLGIETVAAGGGSICDFDGERLTVGPRSAGARPGPASYGAGGPLTLTDVNFRLGRVPAERFPFPLDRTAVDLRLEDLRSRLSSAGHRRTAVAIAEGFLEVANARMAAAIRKISVSRGYDVSDYVLVAFGGAGPQHACAVAGRLGMRRVLVPALAGLLSAVGAGMADVRKFRERSLAERWDEELPHRLEPLFRELEDAATNAVLDDGVHPSNLCTPRREAELRYFGQEASLAVPAATSAWRDEFESAHRKLYGYVHAGRPVEVVLARVEAVGRSSATVVGPEASEEVAAADSEGDRIAVFAGREVPTPLVDGDRVPEDPLPGPAIIASRHHTTVVEPGWLVHRDPDGSLLLERQEEAGPSARRPHAWGLRDPRPVQGASTPPVTTPPDVDPVRLEVFHQQFAAIAEEMGLVLRRTALSTNVKERLDFSCAVFDPGGGMVANAPHIPVHIGAMGECVRHVTAAVDDLGPGDVIVTNDPFQGGSHLPDVTVVTPVYDKGTERLLFFVASRAHHAEIGGKRPGSMPPDSVRLSEEGVILSNLKVLEHGVPRWDRLRSALDRASYPSRSPEENLADIEAQIAANRRGTALLVELVEACGLDEVLAYMGHIQDAARRLMQQRLERLGPGAFGFVDFLDDGTVLRVELRSTDSGVIVDFRGTSSSHPGNFNATPAIVSSAVLYAFRSLLSGDLPLNAGVLAPIEILLPECFLNPPRSEDPRRSPAVAGGNVETSQRIADVVLASLGAAAASQGTMNNLIFGNERFGYYETIAGGAGAGPGFHGASAVHTHMTNTRITDVEVLERRYPVRVRRFSVRQRSGGAGRWRGGDGVVRELEFLAPLEVSILSSRRRLAPFGMAGGRSGMPGRNLLRRGGASEWEELGGVATLSVQPGDVLRIETPGGGGYGKT